MTSLSAGSKPKKPLCPHKMTDFRYKLWQNERRAVKDKAKRNSFRVSQVSQPPSSRRNVVTVDTSKAKSNLDVVRLCLHDLGWREYPFGKREGGPCDIYWQGASYKSDTELSGGRINKFPGMVEITRKVNLGRTLDIMHRLFPDDYDFHPQSWFLPQQYAEFAQGAQKINEKRKDKDKAVFIVKPDDGSQGDGIYLITEPKSYTFNNKYHIVQEYLADPFLIEDLKFDLRVYVLLKSIEPLEIYIYNEGLARFCTVPYEQPTNKNLHEAYMHLTNYSLNKRSSTYQHTENEDDGSKRTMSSVFKKLKHMGYDSQRIWEEIKKLVVKTVIAITPELKVELRAEIPPNKPGPSCFQILGFDVMLMKDMQPMLLEVNASPSLRIDYEQEVALGIHQYIHSPIDEEIKRPLVFHTLMLMAPKHKIRGSSILKRKPRERLPKVTGNSLISQNSANRNTKHRKQKRKEQGMYFSENSDSSQEEESTEESTAESEAEESEPRMSQWDLNTLESIYPQYYEELYDELRLMERTVEIFLYCLGVRGSLRMGPTSFRNFVRRCKLVSGGTGFAIADYDIMYIDLQRRWEYMNPDRRTGGVCYQGFLEVFSMLAEKKFPNNEPLQCVEKMLAYCETHLDFGPDHKPKSSTLPKLSNKEQKIEHIRSVYNQPNSLRKSNLASISMGFFIDYKNLPAEFNRKATLSSVDNLEAIKKSSDGDE